MGAPRSLFRRERRTEGAGVDIGDRPSIAPQVRAAAVGDEGVRRGPTSGARPIRRANRSPLYDASRLVEDRAAAGIRIFPVDLNARDSETRRDREAVVSAREVVGR